MKRAPTRSALRSRRSRCGYGLPRKSKAEPPPSHSAPCSLWAWRYIITFSSAWRHLEYWHCGKGGFFTPRVTAGAVGAMAALVVLYPQIVNSLSAQQRGAFGDWALPSLSKLQAVYLGFFPLVTVPLVLIAVMASLGRSHERLLPATRPGERISWLFLSVPLAAFVAAKLVTHLFVDRYMIVAVPGIAVAVACLFWRHCQESRYLS